MSFEMKPRPKKPNEWGEVRWGLWYSIPYIELAAEVEKFMKHYPHITVNNIVLEYCGCDDNSCDYGMYLAAAGKSKAVYEKEMDEYRKKLKAWKEWRAEHKDELDQWKADEKKRIEKNKLERRRTRLLKEAAEVEAKLNKVK